MKHRDPLGSAAPTPAWVHQVPRGLTLTLWLWTPTWPSHIQDMQRIPINNQFTILRAPSPTAAPPAPCGDRGCPRPTPQHQGWDTGRSPTGRRAGIQYLQLSQSSRSEAAPPHAHGQAVLPLCSSHQKLQLIPSPNGSWPHQGERARQAARLPPLPAARSCRFKAKQTLSETPSAGNHATNICSSNGIMIHGLLIGAWQRWEVFASPGFAQSHNSLLTRSGCRGRSQTQQCTGRSGAVPGRARGARYPLLHPSARRAGAR